eukprot:scaffold23915_cov132-Cylindrotheca_fusiformis.AAC.5
MVHVSPYDRTNDNRRITEQIKPSEGTSKPKPGGIQRSRVTCSQIFASFQGQILQMILSALGLMMAMPHAAWSFVGPQLTPSSTKLSMTDGNDDEGPVMNKWSR